MSDDYTPDITELAQGERFCFRCAPENPCFNACCADLTLQLTPFDALRLRRGLGLDSKTFLDEYAQLAVSQETGWPLLLLRMAEVEGSPCPFVTPEGCSVYPHRPGPCRTYPVGRAMRRGEDGSFTEAFYLVREPHCQGFEREAEWDTTSWCADQGLEPDFLFNEVYGRLLAKVMDLGRPIPPKFANMAIMALYQPDGFQKFLSRGDVFETFGVPAERREAILADEEEALMFGTEWLTAILFKDEP
jgi:hypothetical protein